MKIFSLGGLLLFLVYYVVIDQALGFGGVSTYKSPFAAGLTAYSGKGSFDTKATVIGSFSVLAGALILVYVAPKIF